MRLYVYADESGTFDQRHNRLFVYGGIILAGAAAKEETTCRFIALERSIRDSSRVHAGAPELKASSMTMRERKRAFMSLRNEGCRQFATIVDQTRLREEVFDSKRRKQRYLDYALVRGIEDGIRRILRTGRIARNEVDSVSIVVDEHSASTRGRLDFAESINDALRCGEFDHTWSTFFPPVFSREIPAVSVAYVDSRNVALVRAADITANWAYMATRDKGTYPRAFAALRAQSSLLQLPPSTAA